MALLAVNEVVPTGFDFTTALAAATEAGDTAQNDGTMCLVVANDDSENHTVTVTAQNTSVYKPGYANITFSNIAVAVPAGETIVIGPFPPAIYNNASGIIAITYDAVTSVTIAAAKVQRV